MPRIKRIENAEIAGNLYIQVNATLRDKFDIALSGNQEFVWCENHVNVKFVCKKCNWVCSFNSFRYKEIPGNVEFHLKRHHYFYHKEQRSVNSPIHKIPMEKMPHKEIRGEKHRTETRDCTVFAFAAAFDLDYDSSHALLKKHGRPDRGGSWKACFAAIEELNSDNFRIVRRRELEAGLSRETYRRVGMTLNQLVTQIDATKRYLVGVSAHLLAIKEGKLFDHSRGGKRRIIYLWEIEKLG